MTLNKRYIILIIELIRTRKELITTQKKLAQIKLKLINKQSKNNNIPEFSFFANPVTSITSNQSVIIKKKQRLAKILNTLQYKSDYKSFKLQIIQLKIKLNNNNNN